MSIWNKVLIGFIFVASVVFFYMALRTLKTHQHWRVKVQNHEKKLKEVQQQNVQLVEADGEDENVPMGIRQLRLELHKLLIDRGRVWYGCTPGQADPQTGAVAVTTDLPDPHRITPKTALYIFEETEIDQTNPAQSGRYLGEFKVTDVADKQVQLAPAMKLDDEELRRLAASAGTWTLYEKMPADNHLVFADADEAKLEKLLPKDCLAEYVNDGQMISVEEARQLGLEGKVVAVDEDGRVVHVDENGNVVQIGSIDENGEVTYEDQEGNQVEVATLAQQEIDSGTGKYIRPLHDYDIMLKEYHLQRSVMADRIESSQRDRDKMFAARDDAETQRKFREKELAEVKVELAEAIQQRRAATDYRDSLQRELDARRQEIVQLIAANRQIVGEITRIQLEAARRIDERTRRMAQSAVPGN